MILTLPLEMIALILSFCLDYRTQTTIAISLALLRRVCRVWRILLDNNKFINDDISRSIGWCLPIPSFPSLDPLKYFIKSKEAYKMEKREVVYEDGVVKVVSTGKIHVPMNGSFSSFLYSKSEFLNDYIIALHRRGESEVIYGDERSFEEGMAHPTPTGILYPSRELGYWVNKDIEKGEVVPLPIPIRRKVNVFFNTIISDSSVYSMGGALLWRAVSPIVPLAYNFVLVGETIYDVISGFPLVTIENVRIVGVSRNERGFKIHVTKKTLKEPFFNLIINLGRNLISQDPHTAMSMGEMNREIHFKGSKSI